MYKTNKDIDILSIKNIVKIKAQAPDLSWSVSVAAINTLAQEQIKRNVINIMNRRIPNICII